MPPSLDDASAERLWRRDLAGVVRSMNFCMSFAARLPRLCTDPSRRRRFSGAATRAKSSLFGRHRRAWEVAMVELQQWRACVRGGLSLAARDCLRRRPRLPLPSRRAAAATPPPAELAGRACEVVVVSRQHARQGEDGEEDGEDAMYMTCGDYSSGEKLFKNHLCNQTSFYLSHNYFFKANFQKNPHSYFFKATFQKNHSRQLLF